MLRKRYRFEPQVLLRLDANKDSLRSAGEPIARSALRSRRSLVSHTCRSATSLQHFAGSVEGCTWSCTGVAFRWRRHVQLHAIRGRKSLASLRETPVWKLRPLPSEPHSAWFKPKPADHTTVLPTPARSRVSEPQAKQPTLVSPNLLRGVAASSVSGTT